MNQMDVLNEVLQSVRLRSAIYCRARMSGNWGFRVEVRDHARFHFVKSGRCWAEIDGWQSPVRLDSGDLLILTRGQGHVLRSNLDSRVEPLTDLLKRMPLDQRKNFVWENGRSATTMLCGGFRLEEQRANPLLSTLPAVLVVRDGMQEAISLKAAFGLAETEMQAGRIGAEALVSRMSDVIFLHAIRSCLSVGGAQVGLLKGLTDRKIGKALTAMHDRISHPWTVESLAREAGMSRSGFSSSFTELVGEPPMTYLAQWRLNRAAALLRSNDCKISQVAAAVGYDSEASLSRAFRRCFELSPGEYRRHHAAMNDGLQEQAALSRIPLYPSDFQRDGRNENALAAGKRR